jgi:hypothetical protein
MPRKKSETAILEEIREVLRDYHSPDWGPGRPGEDPAGKFGKIFHESTAFRIIEDLAGFTIDGKEHSYTKKYRAMKAAVKVSLAKTAPSP